MNDLEICKRIAEIEGLSVANILEAASREYHENVCVIIPNGENNTHSYWYNPLTDDALCFQLMVKYDIRVESFEPTLKDGSDGYEYHCYKQGALNYAKNTLSISKSPNKSICLAIIEAHKCS